MLVEFSFENFKCYRDQVTLQMEAAPINEHSASLLEGLGGRQLLPVSVVYGPNGGGKSSVLQAFETLRNYLILPDILFRQRGERVPEVVCRPFAFDEDAAGLPTTFRVLFEKGGYTYRYILSVKDGVVCEEYLHRRKPGKGAQATLFERSDGSVELGSSLKRKSINTDVDEMMPYISFLAINYDIEPIEDAFEWFRNCKVLDYSESFLENYFMEPRTDEQKEAMLGFLRQIGIDITDIRYQHGTSDELEGIYLKHGAGDKELEVNEESNGTRKLLNLAPLLLDAMNHGTVVVSDELDAKLHPKLLRFIVRLFTSRKTNPNGAQLIFTSHDMSTMNSSMFRRDEIWFAARSDEGSSTLYSLADIADIDGRRIRTQNAYDRQYLEGRYGADPYLKNMLEWNEVDE